jgi:hypothetical protein
MRKSYDRTRKASTTDTFLCDRQINDNLSRGRDLHLHVLGTY